MTGRVIPLKRAETVRRSLLRMGAAGPRIQRALAIWFDLLHKRSIEDRNACILTTPEIVNRRSVVFARNTDGAPEATVVVGNELTRVHTAIATDTVREVSLATPVAFTHQWGPADNAVHSLVLPFGPPHRLVVVLFDW